MLPEGKQVLLIDDASEIGETEAALRALGLQVATADAAIALERAAREEFDVAMVGVRQAGDGETGLISRLRGTASIPSLILLARSDEVRQAIRGLAQGADDYLLKPIDPVEIHARIGRILAWQELDA